MNHFYIPPSHTSKHPTTNETIDRIIESMAPETEYPFEKIWSACFERVDGERHFNTRESKRCFNKLLKEGLVTCNKQLYADYYGGNSEVTIKLTEKGDKIREGEGWKNHLIERSKIFDKVIRWVAIAELAVIVFQAFQNYGKEKRLDAIDAEYILLEKETQIQSEKIDRLYNLLRSQEIEIQALKDSISAN